MANIREKITPDELMELKNPGYSDMDEDAQFEVWDKISEHDKYLINKLTTKANGYGEDRLYINEASRQNDIITISKFKNLLEWDIECWNLQRKWRNEDVDENNFYDIGKYDFNKGMTGEWIRFIEDSRLVYASMYSLSGFLWSNMEDLVLEIENEIIPHEYKWEPPLENDGDEEETCGNNCKCRRVQINIDANGREEEYEKLRKLTYEYITHDGRGESIIKKLAKKFTGTFRIDKFEKIYDPYSDFIVCDKETLRKINPETFLTDFKSFLNDKSILDDLLNKVKELIDSDYRQYVKENM